MFSISFGDIDIAGCVALGGRLSFKPRLVSVHRNFLTRASKWISYNSAKQRGDNVAPGEENSAQDSSCKDPKRKEASYAVVLTDRMPEPAVLANC